MNASAGRPRPSSSSWRRSGARSPRAGLRPGAPIRQDALAGELGVSRVLLREALKTLQGEGLVGYRAHRGYCVEELSLDDLREVYRIREILEEEAVRQALARLSDDDVVELEKAQLGVERAAEAADVLGMAEANRAFHMRLYTCAGMPRLTRLIAAQWDATDAYRSIYYGEDANRARVIAEHHAALDALRRRDVDEALRVLDLHRAHAVAALEDLSGLR